MDENLSIFGDVQLLTQVAHAGFPSPADDYRERPLAIGDLVVTHPLSTYYMRVEGDSMQGVCICSNDVLVVDRAVTPSHNRIVVARLGTDFTVKRLQIIKGSNRMFLKPENPKYQLMEVTHSKDFEIWGCVIWVLHKLTNTR